MALCFSASFARDAGGSSGNETAEAAAAAAATLSRRPCFGLALEAGATMYQYLSGETAVRRAAAPRVRTPGRTAPRGVPDGRNPSARTACACVCPMLCDPLCLLPVRHVFSPCPGSRRLNVSISTRGDRCAPRCGATGAHNPPGLAPRLISESAGAQRKAAGLSVTSAAAGGVSRRLLGICCASRHNPLARGQEPSSDR
jgi:hypothetical protein